MTTILITGFGPFPGVRDNPTARLAAWLAGARRPLLDLHPRASHVFPTSYRAIDRELPALIARHRPQVLIMFGLAARTNFLRIERQAHNRVSAIFPDARGFSPALGAIRRDAAAALRSDAPLMRLRAAARAVAMDCRLSNDAGRYVCNYAYWRALEAAAKPGGPQIVVFLHVPKLHDWARPAGGRPRPSFARLTHAAAAVLICAMTAARRR